MNYDTFLKKVNKLRVQKCFSCGREVVNGARDILFQCECGERWFSHNMWYTIANQRAWVHAVPVIAFCILLAILILGISGFFD